MDNTADVAQRLRIRFVQIDDRIRQLRERNESMLGHRMTKGSTPEQALRAANFATLAHERAAAAAGRSVSAHMHAASAHDHAAGLLEDLAAADRTDGTVYRAKARNHRAWAEAERDAAWACAGLGPVPAA